MHSIELTNYHQLCTKVIEKHTTVYPTVQLRTPTSRQGKAIKNDVMTTAYHQWYHGDVTTVYTHLQPGSATMYVIIVLAP